MKAIVSVITPLFNSEAFISETIQSVINQSYSNWELILIDDASTDKTVAIAEAFIIQNSNITLLKNERNQGAAISRNKGIAAAKGNFIAFLDADDLWKSNKLELQIAFMQSKKMLCLF